MTRRIIGGPAGTSTAPVTQNYSSYVLLAETSSIAGTVNSVSGMTNPVMIDGTTTLEFANIPQTYRDLKIVFGAMGHNTSNSSGYRIMMTLNSDTNNNRYYTRAENRDGTWNVDNTSYLYYGYLYRPDNVTWTGAGEIYIPNYSTTMGGWNSRTFYGFWSHMNQSAYMVNFKFDYYNSTDADKAITNIKFRNESDVAYRQRSKISIYGIGTV